MNAVDLFRYHSTAKDWTKLEESSAKSYLPKASRSVRFQQKLCQQGKEVTGDVASLGLFESVVNDASSSAATFFAGGPIWASSWCPMDGSKGDHVVALFADADFEADPIICPTEKSFSRTAASLIQFWTLQGSSSGISRPVFSMGLASDHGRVRSLQWCPSGGTAQQSDSCLSRLGLLAAGFEDGIVRIFPVPELSSLPEYDSTDHSLNIYKCDGSFVTLRRPDRGRDDDYADVHPCVKVVWFRGHRHRVVAASYADGNVALWDLETTSGLLRDDETNSIYPYKFFRTHLRNNLTYLDFSAESDADGFPVHLVTGSTDRMLATWDLTSPDDVPVREFRRFYVTDVAWMSHYPGNTSSSYDDSCLMNSTR